MQHFFIFFFLRLPARRDALDMRAKTLWYDAAAACMRRRMAQRRWKEKKKNSREEQGDPW
jgi:hypothetical protein